VQIGAYLNGDPCWGSQGHLKVLGFFGNLSKPTLVKQTVQTTHTLLGARCIGVRNWTLSGGAPISTQIAFHLALWPWLVPCLLKARACAISWSRVWRTKFLSFKQQKTIESKIVLERRLQHPALVKDISKRKHHVNKPYLLKRSCARLFFYGLGFIFYCKPLCNKAALWAKS
jgi:hypothetical protein